MKNEQYLFSWDKVPGNENDKLIKFLMVKFDNEWIKQAQIEKIDEGRTIKVSSNKNYILLELHNSKTIVKLEIYNNIINKKRTYELKIISKKENGFLNIYKEHINVRILRTLLESPKTNGEVGKALGYVQKIKTKDYGNYHNVIPALQKLKDDKLITRAKGDEKTHYGTTNAIEYNIDNIKKIAEDHPSLIPDLQKKDQVLKILSDEHQWMTDLYCRNIVPDASTLSILFENLDDFKSCDKFELILPFRKEVREKLQTSPTFFRLLVNKSSEELKRRTDRIKELESENKLLKPKDNIMITLLDIVFETCVYSDILNGEESDIATRYIYEKNKFNLSGKSRWVDWWNKVKEEMEKSEKVSR